MARNKQSKEISKLVATHKGVLIIHHIEHYYDSWGLVRDTHEHFELCKPNGMEEPWKRAENRLFTYYRSIADARNGIDRYLNGDTILYTDAQYNKYISNYNKKHGWGFTKPMLLTTMRMHKKGDKVMKRLMEDRLEDANFHNYCAALADGDYDKFMKFLIEEYH